MRGRQGGVRVEKHGKFLGMVPYDFRKPSLARVKERMWNPEDERIITPRDFGIGWTLNLYQLHQKYPQFFYLLIAAVALRIIFRISRFLKRLRSD
jgi:hypothetical protein